MHVLTASDLPVRNLREAIDNRTILVAHERVTYVGRPVAVVLGETEAAAEDGATAVEVDYEPLPASIDIFQALDPDAPVVRSNTKASDEELAMHGAAAGGKKQEKPKAPSISNQQRYVLGDVDKGFEEADVIVEREYRTPWVHESYIEPQVCAATVDPLGRIMVYACTPAMFRTRDTIAAVLGKAPADVRGHRHAGGRRFRWQVRLDRAAGGGVPSPRADRFAWRIRASRICRLATRRRHRYFECEPVRERTGPSLRSKPRSSSTLGPSPAPQPRTPRCAWRCSIAGQTWTLPRPRS